MANLILLQTLYPVSNRTMRVGIGDIAFVEDQQNTYAGTHDMLDTTLDVATDAGGGSFADNPAHLQYAVDYQVTTANQVGQASGFIVRVNFRVQTGGDFAGCSGVANAYVNQHKAGNQLQIPDLVLGSNTWYNYSVDLPVDPTDGNPWTNAKVNAYRYGFFGECWSQQLNGDVDFACSEFYVELWSGTGNLPTPPVNQPNFVQVLPAVGVMGDHNDATMVSTNDGGQAGLLNSGYVAFATSSLTWAINYIRFGYRGNFSFADQGPKNPFNPYISFKEGAGGTLRTSPTDGLTNSIATMIFGPDFHSAPIPKSFAGTPWTWAKINTLIAAFFVQTNDDGSQVVTTINIAELWIEIYGFHGQRLAVIGG